MSDNPYSPPAADLERAPAAGGIAGTGDVDIGRCLSDAWAATWENFPLWLGVGIVGSLAMVLATVSVLGIPLLLPHLVWGSYNFVLRMHDGEAEFGDLFEGFSRYAAVLGSVLGAGLAFVALNVVFQSIQIFGAATDSTMLILLGYVVVLAFGIFVSPRLMLCFFYLVERDMGGIEALQAAWAATDRAKWKFAVMVLLSYAIVLVGALALLIGLIPATAITYLMWASAYRQIEGRPAG